MSSGAEGWKDFQNEWVGPLGSVGRSQGINREELKSVGVVISWSGSKV